MNNENLNLKTFFAKFWRTAKWLMHVNYKIEKKCI